ncbi:MAG: hypothetical protein ACRCRU_00340 [Vibrio sp.]|uniref:hypothetical protein n=1 Tax=Vibrio sp. TaxID=678 RepID=UPI003F3CBFD1
MLTAKINTHKDTLESAILAKADNKRLSEKTIRKMSDILSTVKNSPHDQRMATLATARDYLGFVKSTFVEKQISTLITQHLQTPEEIALFKNSTAHIQAACIEVVDGFKPEEAEIAQHLVCYVARCIDEHCNTKAQDLICRGLVNEQNKQQLNQFSKDAKQRAESYFTCSINSAGASALLSAVKVKLEAKDIFSNIPMAIRSDFLAAVDDHMYHVLNQQLFAYCQANQLFPIKDCSASQLNLQMIVNNAIHYAERKSQQSAPRKLSVVEFSAPF